MVITERISTLTIDHPFERRPAITAGAFQEVVSPNTETALVKREPKSTPRRSLWTRKTVAFNRVFQTNILGTIEGQWQHIVARPANVDDQKFAQQESKYSYTFVPAEWLRNMGLSHSFRFRISTSPTTGWQHTLQTPCLVPGNSLIFTLCEQGNIDAIRSLLAEGRASVRDENASGFTPLWVRYDCLSKIS